MTPKILHLYWGCNKPLSYLRSLTIKSFAKFNPDWKINIFVPKNPSKLQTWDSHEQAESRPFDDCFDDIKHLAEVIEFDFEAHGIPESIPEVHKSDLIRWYLLGEYGGVWSDFDILYIRPMYKAGIEHYVGAGLCKYNAMGGEKQFQAIGFLTGSKEGGRKFFSELFKFGIASMPKKEYQAFGVTLLEAFLSKKSFVNQFVYYLPPELVYHYYQVGTMNRYFKSLPLHLDPATIGLHWYAGSPKVAMFEGNITKVNIGVLDWSICQEAVKAGVL